MTKVKRVLILTLFANLKKSPIHKYQKKLRVSSGQLQKRNIASRRLPNFNTTGGECCPVIMSQTLRDRGKKNEQQLLTVASVPADTLPGKRTPTYNLLIFGKLQNGSKDKDILNRRNYGRKDSGHELGSKRWWTRRLRRKNCNALSLTHCLSSKSDV